MPGLNGFELTQKVRASDKLRCLPVIALTALSADRYIQKGREAGVDAYEIKLDKECLRTTLETHPFGQRGQGIPASAASSRELISLDKLK